MRWNKVELEGALEEMMKKITINIVMLGPLEDGIDTANLNGTFVVIVYIGVVEARGTPNPKKASSSYLVSPRAQYLASANVSKKLMDKTSWDKLQEGNEEIRVMLRRVGAKLGSSLSTINSYPNPKYQSLSVPTTSIFYVF